jgi:rod shape-determining protein MreC
MATSAATGIARRRAVLRRVVIAVLVIVCLAIFTGYFRETDSGPLHGAQSAAAAVVAPVQEVATRAVQPFRDAWGWASSLKDARDRAASLQAEVGRLRGMAVENVVRDQRLRELEGLLGVEKLTGPNGAVQGYEPVTGFVITRSVTDWSRSARIDKGTSDGVIVNSPVVAGSSSGAALVGLVTEASSGSAEVSFITNGRTEVGATIPEAGNWPGLLQSITPGQLQLGNIPREAGVREGQAVVTGGFGVKSLPPPYPPGLPVGQVTSVGRKEVDVQLTVQVTPYVDPRPLHYLVVLTPRSPEALRRARG